MRGALATLVAAAVLCAAPLAGATFDAPEDHEVGNTPVSMVKGDFNDDGKTDLATANLFEGTGPGGDGTVSILRGKARGNFKPASEFDPTVPESMDSTDPRDLAVADFNRDGDQDLAVALSDEDRVAILLGQGDATFLPAPIPQHIVGDMPWAIAAAKVDGDNKADLVTVNQTDQTASVLLGKANGNFDPAIPTDVIGAGLNELALSDLDRDGNVDIAAVDGGAGLVSILYGQGDGGFDPPEELDGPDIRNSDIVVSRLNRGRRKDLAIVNTDPDRSISVLLGKRGGDHFRSPEQYEVGDGVGDDTPFAIAAGKVNGDRRRDLVTANLSDDEISLLRGRRNGTFRDQKRFDVGNGPNSVVISDFDRDGKRDVAALNQIDDAVAILFN